VQGPVPSDPISRP